MKRILGIIWWEIKTVLMIIGAFAPLTLYMDYVMGVVLTRDYSGLIALGFICCVVFYSEMSARHIRFR